MDIVLRDNGTRMMRMELGGFGYHKLFEAKNFDVFAV